MKNIFKAGLISVMLVVSSCNEKVVLDNTGSVSLELSEFIDTYITKAEGDVNTDLFKVMLVGQNGNSFSAEWLLKDVPSIIDNLPSGDYKVLVNSHEEEPDAAFDSPVYTGESDVFSVEVGKVSPVKVVCSIQNLKITVNPSQSFLNELTVYAITITNGKGTLSWTNDPNMTGTNVTNDITKAGYFSVAPLDITITGYREVSQKSAKWEGKISSPSARDHYDISIDANTTGQIGGITIEVDGSVNIIETPIEVPGFEDVPVDGPDNGDNEEGGENEGDDSGSGDKVPAGTLTWDANPDLSPMDIVDGMSVEMVLNIPKGIKGFVIKLESDTPAFMSLCSQMTSTSLTEEEVSAQGYVVIDLINDPTAVVTMSGVGIPTGTSLTEDADGIINFSLSTLVPMIPTAGQAGPNTDHTFHLTVTDKEDNTSTWSLTFHVPGSDGN